LSVVKRKEKRRLSSTMRLHALLFIFSWAGVCESWHTPCITPCVPSVPVRKNSGSMRRRMCVSDVCQTIARYVWRAQVPTYTLTQVYKCAGIAKYSCTLESFKRREAIGLLLLFPASALAGVQLSVRKCDENVVHVFVSVSARSDSFLLPLPELNQVISLNKPLHLLRCLCSALTIFFPLSQKLSRRRKNTT
jgi:hypothetical protein